MTLTPLEIHQKVLDAWAHYYPPELDDTQIQQFIAQIRVLDQLDTSGLAAMFFGYHNFKIYYANKKLCSYFDTTAESLVDTGFSELIPSINEEQNLFALQFNKILAGKFMSESPETLLNKSSSSYVNWQITTKNGKRSRVLVQIFPAMLDANNKPLLAMYLLYDMKPFLHPHTWWARTQLGASLQHYTSSEKIIKTGDIISQREMEVLKLLQEGCSSKEIANKLHLSSNTVDNHRRNMLLRTGAMDTSSLVYVCTLCRIL